MSDPTILYQEHESVALVTLNRPDNLNSLNLEMHQALWAALDRAEANPHLRALVITGAGRGFVPAPICLASTSPQAPIGSIAPTRGLSSNAPSTPPRGV